MKFHRLPELLGIIGISRSKLYADIKAGTFPPPVNLGGRAVGWLSTEIDAWIMTQANARQARCNQNWSGA